MSLSPPRSKKIKLSPTKQIGDLADNDLTEIFKRLPPCDRLIASEVCRRWFGLSRKAWVDVKHLDLNPIPGKHITSIIKQCPNLASVLACGKSFDLVELAYLSKSRQLSSVKLYDCKFAAKVDIADNFFTKVFGDNLQQALWTELIIHNARFEDRTVAAYSGLSKFPVSFSAEFLPASLTRLQLSDLYVTRTGRLYHFMSLNALDRFQNLECECLILHDYTPSCDLVEGALTSALFEKICALKDLKELCVGPVLWFSRQGRIGRLIASLPKLEVLFLSGTDYDTAAEDLKDLIRKNCTLRILILSGWVYQTNSDTIDLPARKRFPQGFGSDPLPLLHVFVGKAASKKFRFAKSSSDALIIHPINQPMPQFLEREDIAPLFEGVWMAEQIKATAKSGSNLWHSAEDDAGPIQSFETESG